MERAERTDMKIVRLISVVLFVGAVGAAVDVGCKSLGEWATAEDQRIWSTYPCMLRGAQYPNVCIDDFTNPEAGKACPCHPTNLIEILSGSPEARTDAGVVQDASGQR